nr:unnamed protein product [Callosobruchus analis]
MSFLELLIEEVRKHDCLWNKSLESYRNQNIRDNAWERISIELKKPVDDIKREWKKLQDCYRQAMLRRKTKSGQFATKTKPWKYEELMSFLASDTLPRSTQSNVLDPDDENTENVEPTESNDDTQGQHEEEENALEDDQSNSALNSQGPRYNKSLKSNRTNVQKADDGVQKVITFLSKKESNKNKNGELDYFFASACESTDNGCNYKGRKVSNFPVQQEEDVKQVPTSVSSVPPNRRFIVASQIERGIPTSKIQIVEDWLLGVQPKCLYTVTSSEQRDSAPEKNTLEPFQHTLEYEPMNFAQTCNLQVCTNIADTALHPLADDYTDMCTSSVIDRSDSFTPLGENVPLMESVGVSSNQLYFNDDTSSCRNDLEQDDDDSVADPDYIPDCNRNDELLNDEPRLQNNNMLLEGSAVTPTKCCNDHPNKSIILNQLPKRSSEISHVRDESTTVPSNLEVEKDVLHFARNIIKWHEQEFEVQKVLSLAKNSLKRRQAVTALRKRGNFLRKKTDATLRPKKSLFRHTKKCPLNYDQNCNKKQTSQSDGQTTLLLHSVYKHDELLKSKIFPRMRADDIGLIAKKDPLICKYAYSYIKGRQSKGNIDLVCQNMRRLAKLLQHARKTNSEIKTLVDILRPVHFQLIIKGVNKMAQYNSEKCQWADEVSAQAGTNLRESKWNKEELLPLTSDLKKLSLFLQQSADQEYNILLVNRTNELSYTTLKEILYTQILLLNRRRPAEVAQLKIQTFKEISLESEDGNEFERCLTETEKILLNTYSRFVIRGGEGSERVDSRNITVNKRSKRVMVGNRQTWTNTQKRLVAEHFSAHIQNKRSPKQHEVLDFVQLYPDLFKERKWTSINAVVYTVNSIKDFLLDCLNLLTLTYSSISIKFKDRLYNYSIGCLKISTRQVNKGKILEGIKLIEDELCNASNCNDKEATVKDGVINSTKIEQEILSDPLNREYKTRPAVYYQSRCSVSAKEPIMLRLDCLNRLTLTYSSLSTKFKDRLYDNYSIGCLKISTRQVNKGKILEDIKLIEDELCNASNCNDKEAIVKDGVINSTKIEEQVNILCSQTSAGPEDVDIKKKTGTSK